MVDAAMTPTKNFLELHNSFLNTSDKGLYERFVQGRESNVNKLQLKTAQLEESRGAVVSDPLSRVQSNLLEF